ncbi:hypothetical protein J6590_067480 [Homalodisca vitripennis]|nr:hypothetical protein J6590_067480 [Homalodisca vitripennis]
MNRLEESGLGTNGHVIVGGDLNTRAGECPLSTYGRTIILDRCRTRCRQRGQCVYFPALSAKEYYPAMSTTLACTGYCACWKRQRNFPKNDTFPTLICNGSYQGSSNRQYSFRKGDQLSKPSRRSRGPLRWSKLQPTSRRVVLLAMFDVKDAIYSARRFDTADALRNTFRVVKYLLQLIEI